VKARLNQNGHVRRTCVLCRFAIGLLELCKAGHVLKIILAVAYGNHTFSLDDKKQKLLQHVRYSRMGDFLTGYFCDKVALGLMHDVFPHSPSN
jgi:hypothetical protein